MAKREPKSLADGGSLSVPSVAAELDVSERTVRNMIYDGDLPNAYRVGPRIWRIPASDVHTYQATNRYKRVDPFSPNAA